MLEVAAAQDEVLRRIQPRRPEVVPVSSSALGLVLAENVAADRDLPPFAKAMMDGVAVRTADCSQAGANLSVVEMITAGNLPTKAIGPGQASRIMTGAAVPEAADAVVMIEDCVITGDRVMVMAVPAVGQHIQPVGQEMRHNETVLRAGAILGPAHFGLLSAIGRTSVKAYPSPWVSLIATGNELVEPAISPGPGQIRNSHAAMLVAQCVQAGALPRSLGIARDERSHLLSLIREGLTADVLILTGGVSAGTLDLVPDVLKEAGVEPIFHKVAMKPGKPLLFGVSGQSLVFGLPGNPVSAFVGFELFVRPAILKLRNMDNCIPSAVDLPLVTEARHASDRPTYHPAEIRHSTSGDTVRLLSWQGSPDLKGLCGANGLALLKPGSHTYAAGSMVPVIRLPA